MIQTQKKKTIVYFDSNSDTESKTMQISHQSVPGVVKGKLQLKSQRFADWATFKHQIAKVSNMHRQFYPLHSPTPHISWVLH